MRKQTTLKGVLINNLDNSDINTSNKILKKIYKFGQKYVVTIDESIIKQLEITEETMFEQEITQNNAILMRIKKI